MVESRCGLKCSECSYREPFGCGGCVQANGHPFYFFSYLDKENGDNPPGQRIEQVKIWAREEEAV